MPLIKNIRTYPGPATSAKRALLLCGFGGSIWQTARLRRVLRRAGYQVTALDFSEEVLSKGDPRLLPALVDEVTAFAEKEIKEHGGPILLVGISLGALLSLNLMRRSKHFTRGVFLTGGDIVKVAHNIYGRTVWPGTYDELAATWKDINMYSDPAQLAGKRLLFVLPARDKLIDPEDVRREVGVQTGAGNTLILMERRSFGHVGTIIEETILFPRRVLGYIEQVKKT